MEFLKFNVVMNKRTYFQIGPYLLASRSCLLYQLAVQVSVLGRWLLLRLSTFLSSEPLLQKHVEASNRTLDST